MVKNYYIDVEKHIKTKFQYKNLLFLTSKRRALEKLNV